MSSMSDNLGATAMLRALESPDDGLRVLVAALPNACFYLSTDLDVEFANEELASLVGRPLGDLLGLHVGEVFGLGQRSEHALALEDALAGRKCVYECPCGMDDAGERQLRVAAKPVLDDAGRVSGILAEAVDITELKQLEQDARKSEARFRLIAEGVPNQLLLLDHEFRIEFANDAFLEASGWTAESAHGRHISEVAGPERFRERVERYERALAGETVAYEADGAAGNQGGYFRFSYRPSYDENGAVQGLLSTATDISALRRMQLELEAKQVELLRSNKDLEQFAYVASHDLKAPLRAIEVLVGWIREELAGHEIGDVQENLDLLRRRTQRLGRLLDDLLAYSRAGRKIGDLKEIDSGELVLDVVQLVDPPETITVEIAGPMPSFSTFPTPLEQVFRNLIGNAIKHHPGGAGHVIVSCDEQPECCVFAVADDGAGIEPQYAERVFQMFQTLKPRDSVEGSGMGLAIVNRIVTWQGGRVWFEPGPDGRGTVFRFEWRKQPPESIGVNP